MIKYLLTFFLLLPSLALAEVTAVINAPDKVNIGDLVVLDSSESKGDNKLWVIDPKAEGRYLKLEHQIVFAIGTPGVYEFQLIVADKEANIGQVKHRVTVGPPVVIPPTPTPTDPPPVNPPVGNNKVRNAVRAATAAVNDPPTAQAMRQALINLTDKSQESVKAEIAKVLFARGPESKNKSWDTLWREPVDKAIIEAKLPFPETVRQIIEGLSSSSPADAKSLVRLTIFTKDNCPPCEQWKREQLPKIPIPEWEIVWKTDPAKPAPSFHICFGENCREIEGYASFETLNSVLASMSKVVK